MLLAGQRLTVHLRVDGRKLTIRAAPLAAKCVERPNGIFCFLHADHELYLPSKAICLDVFYALSIPDCTSKRGEGEKNAPKIPGNHDFGEQVVQKSVSLSFAGFPVYDIDESAILLAVFD